jgi:very-short-patch-repair endonuclease
VDDIELVVETLRELGGVADFARLRRAVSRIAVEQAVSDGRVRRLRRGRYALPTLEPDLAAAHRLTGVLSHESAALWRGWSCGRLPDLPVVTVARHRKVTEAQRTSADVRYADLGPHEMDGRVTSAVRTVLDCARSLPFAEALAVADAALDDGVARNDLLQAVDSGPRTGRNRARAVVVAADGRAANAFESAVRAISLDVDGIALEPQVRVADGITPDLVDRTLRVVVECDSWTYHAEKSAFRHDLERYNELALDGWLVLRVDRDHAMSRPEYVRGLLVRAVAAHSC